MYLHKDNVLGDAAADFMLDQISKITVVLLNEVLILKFFSIPGKMSLGKPDQ